MVNAEPDPMHKGIRNTTFFFFFFSFLAMPCGLWNPSSPTMDPTCAPCRGGKESQPLDDQGIPYNVIFKRKLLNKF